VKSEYVSTQGTWPHLPVLKSFSAFSCIGKKMKVRARKMPLQIQLFFTKERCLISWFISENTIANPNN